MGGPLEGLRSSSVIILGPGKTPQDSAWPQRVTSGVSTGCPTLGVIEKAASF